MTPTLWPEKDPNTGELVDVEYFATHEVAKRLHVSIERVRKMCAEERWPCLYVARRYWMSADDIAEAVHSMRRGEHEATPIRPRRLGVAVDPDDIEGVR